MAASYTSTALSDQLSDPSVDNPVDGVYVRESLAPVSKADWIWTAAFLFSQSLLGLQLWPMVPVVLLMLLIAFKTRPYDFLIMIMIVAGGYSMTVGYSYITILSVVVPLFLILLLRKSAILKRIIILYLAYIAFMLFIAYLSEETFAIQIKRIYNYAAGISFLIPLAVFANRDFDMMKMFNVFFRYVAVYTLFIVLDWALVGGHLFFPYANYMPWDSGYIPSFTHIISHPLTFPRIGNFTLIFLVFGIFPLARYVKLSRDRWALIILALIAVRSATMTAGLIVAYVLFKAKGKNIWKYVVGIIIAVPLLYQVDNMTGGYLRLSSTVDQFTSLDEGMSEEELGELGTGRMAQVIPKLDFLSYKHRTWIGFGFLDPFKSDSHKFTIENDLYNDTQQETATGVEITQIQAVLDMGILGLIVQLITYVGIYFIIRKLKYSGLYLCVIVALYIGGIGGNAGWNGVMGLYQIALALGCVLLANRPPKHDNTARLTSPM